ncbi:MAG: peptidylprolyl isomerase [Acidobacteriota bacterium]|nr:MAG: peptidylprolyl isomerase [Acidobacteriota bacterium]
MSNLTKGIILIVAIVAIGFGLVIWKKEVGGQASESFNQISRSEIELLLADLAKTNPMAVKRLAEDEELKKQQMKNLKQLLAFASQAKKEGMADEPSNRQELDSIRAEVIAVSYDRELNQDKGPMPPFGFISEEQINEFWAQSTPPAGQQSWFANLMGTLGLGKPASFRLPEDEFNDFLNAKIAIMKASNPEMADREISEEERTQAREMFAKSRVYRNEFDRKAAAGELNAEFVAKTNLQVRLQQAQFLARLYSQTLTDKMKVTDEEVNAYIAANPQFDPAEKRNKANEILQRAKAGEDFAALANEFTTDPGNKGPDGKDNGGLYADVPKGRMVAPFEEAALSLEAGQVAPELVETDFGFHIVKLERKLSKKDGAEQETYDVRHILISTGYKDPDNPMAREMPVKDFVRNKLETEKEEKLIEEIVAANGVMVPEDYTVPEVTDEQIQEMQQKQRPPMPMPQPENGENGAPPKPADTKPEAPKKK